MMTRNKTGWTLLAGVLAAALTAGGAAAAGTEPWTAGMGTLKVGPELTEIVLDVDGSATVKLVGTADEVGLSGLTVEGASGEPVSVRRDGGRVTVRLAGKRGFLGLRSGSLKAEFTFLVPAGRTVRVSGGKLSLSGDAKLTALHLSAGSLTAQALSVEVSEAFAVSAGKAVLDMTVGKAKDIRIGAGSVSGKLRIPGSAQVHNSAGSNHLTLLVKDGG